MIATAASTRMASLRAAQRLRTSNTTQLWRLAGRRLQSTASSAKQEPPKKGIKALMSKYGYSALGVYLGLSAIDLPICFLLVHSVGPEKMEEWENKVREFVGLSSKTQSSSSSSVSDSFSPDSSNKSEVLLSATQVIQDGIGKLDLGSEHSHTSTSGSSDSSSSSNKWFGIDRRLLAEFGIAYALHKSLIFIRVPITAAITPSVVKLLQRWGFNVGKKSLGAVNASSAATAAERVKNFGTSANSRQKWWSWFF